MPNILYFSLLSQNPTVNIINTENFFTIPFAELCSFDDILRNFKIIRIDGVKAILIEFWSGCAFQRQAEIAATLKHYYQSEKIPVFYCTRDSNYASALLLECIDEHGVNILKDNIKIIVCEGDTVTKLCITRRKNDYKLLLIPGILMDSKEDIVTKDQSQTFITYAKYPNVQISEKQKQDYNMIVKLFHQQSKTILPIKKESPIICRPLAKKALHLLGIEKFEYDVAANNITDYAVMPISVLNSMVHVPVPEALKKSLICAGIQESIPLKKKIVCYENFYDISLIHFDLPGSDVIQGFPFIETGTSLCLSIDEYFIPSLEVNSNNNATMNGAMICFSDEKFTVQRIKDEKLIDVGLNSVPLAIAFVDDKIQIGKEAIKLKEKQNLYVITDLIKILRTPAADLKADQKWGFEIIKDEDNQTLLEFDTFRGRRRATPTFLFAFFIRYAVKSIEVISGQMPATIVLVSKNLNDDFREQLMASCKSAKLNINNVQIHEYKIVEING